ADEIGTKQTDLKQYQGNLVPNSAVYTFTYYDRNNVLINNPGQYSLTVGQNIVYVEIKSATGCAARAKLTLPLKASPIVNLPTDAEYCPGSFVKLDPGNQPTGTTFVWTYNGTALSSHQTVNADRTGVYSLTVTNAVGCSTTKSVNVKQVELPVISDIKIENTTVHIIVAGNGMFEYSIDGISWQASNTFHNVPAGNHTAFVRSGTQ